MTAKQKLRPLAISMGDPAGVGAEVILKAAAKTSSERNRPTLVVVGDFAVMDGRTRRLGIDCEPYRWQLGQRLDPRGLAVLEVGKLSSAGRRLGHGTIEGGEAAYRYVVEGARLVLDGHASALVTAPIHKEWLNRAGHNFAGHSELLAHLTRTRLWRMMFAGEQLRLALVTVHVALAEVPRLLSTQRVSDTIRLLASHLSEQLAMARPRIAVFGFNPHAGEGGLFGDEERRAIAPAIACARRAGIDAFGPVAADTAFLRRDGRFSFDAAVAMYHDQGLIGLKALEFDRAVNITLGLPFVRTSPDHGTAFDIAGRGVADPGSMLAAIRYAWRAVSRRSAKLERGTRGILKCKTGAQIQIAKPCRR